MSCNLCYVGKPKCELKTRICEHKYSIRNHDDKSSVARHFNSHNHSLSELYWMGIEKVKMPRRGANIGKAYWIHCLYTIIPSGMNKEIVFACFLWCDYCILCIVFLLLWDSVLKKVGAPSVGRYLCWLRSSIITSPVYTHSDIVRIQAEEGRLCGNIEQFNWSAVLACQL